MKILAIDTSTEACSAALLIDEQIRKRYQLAPRDHTRLILPMIDALLAESGLKITGLDALAFGCGPGSFTGVRIAASVAQGLAFGADLPVTAISSLAALAQGTYRDLGVRQVLAAIDARMGEVYWGAYRAGDDGLVRLEGSETVCLPEHAPLPTGRGWFGAGTGWETYQKELCARMDGALSTWEGQRHPRAEHVALLGADLYRRGLAIAAEQALPVYLRDEVAWKKSG